MSVCRDDPSTIRAESHIADGKCVPAEGKNFEARPRVPNLDSRIVVLRWRITQFRSASGSNSLSVRAEGHGCDGITVPAHGKEFVSGLCIPDFESLVPTCRYDLLTVWAEGHAADGIGVSTKCKDLDTCFDIPEFDGLVFAC